MGFLLGSPFVLLILMQVHGKIRHDIQQYGWHVIGVTGNDAIPAFSYTIGLMESYGHPELLVMGLRMEVMHYLLNEAGALVRDGRPILMDTDMQEFLDDYPVRFRTIHPSNIRDYFGTALNYYQRNDLPAMQLIYPDKAYKWPWDEAFSASKAEQVLDREIAYKFADPENTAAFSTKQVFHEHKPILIVTHDPDGEWQFLHGDGEELADLMLVALGEVVKRDPSVNRLFNLPVGYMAEREAPGADWVWRENPNNDEYDDV